METRFVSVLGGGQLGRMLALAGRPLGIEFRFLDPSPDATAGRLAPLVVGELGDLARIDEAIKGAEVVTYEWEGVPAEAARHAMVSVPVRPDPRALDVAQDRLAEKQAFQRLGIDLPRHQQVGEDGCDVLQAVEQIGTPAVLKTRRGGYDGKGQWVVRTTEDARTAQAELGSTLAVLEEMVPFTRELSVLAVRGLDGETLFYPLVENEHRGGILRVSRAPASNLSPDLQRAGEELATKLLDDLGYVGVLAVELFEHEGRLLANEIAPRVHNSGHWTIEGADTSQFENHLRAILGMPLGSTYRRGYSAMVNCIGALPDPAAVGRVEGAHLHDYEKEPRAGRKVGHITVVEKTPEARDEKVDALRALVDIINER